MSKKKVLIIASFVIILVDQITKMLLINKNISIIPDVLEFNYTKNYGIAFGIAEGKTIGIILIEIIVFIIIARLIKKEKSDYKIITPLTIVLAGGISNLIDRIFRGYVVDFIDVNVFNFPCFNIADLVITLSILYLIVYIMVNGDGSP